MIRLDVKKRFSGTQATDFCLDAAFEVRNGFTVLTGPSGAGKTSILRSIAGILRPEQGFIAVGDQIFFSSHDGIDLSIQKRGVGFVFQNYALFPHLTGFQNVAYGIRKDDSDSVETRVDEMLSIFRIEHVSGHLPREMSGGEQQRVALARALASDPSIVLLDEPLSAVDVETRSHLLDEIEAAQKRSNIPFIYVTHNVEEADRVATSRIVIDRGRVVLCT